MRRFFAACLTAAAVAGPAAACLNDGELTTHEREFRSQYNKPAPPPAQVESSPAPTYLLPGAVGVVLLGAAVALTLTAARARG